MPKFNALNKYILIGIFSFILGIFNANVPEIPFSPLENQEILFSVFEK